MELAANQQVNLSGKSYVPTIAPLSPSSYPYRYISFSTEANSPLFSVS